MTDEQLKLMRTSVDGAGHVHAVLIEIEDFLKQISLMATIVSHYQFEDDFPGSDNLQVRMIGRLADQGLKMLEPAAEQLDSVSQQAGRIVWDIELDKMREQEEKAKQDGKVINLLQVTEDRITN